MSSLKDEVQVGNQQKVSVTSEKLRKLLSKMLNWKVPGPNLKQGFWLKNFLGLHIRLIDQLKMYLIEERVPAWMTKGRTVLIMKDLSKGYIASNYRPVTCLILVWKLLSGIIVDEMYMYLEDSKLLPEDMEVGAPTTFCLLTKWSLEKLNIERII